MPLLPDSFTCQETINTNTQLSMPSLEHSLLKDAEPFEGVQGAPLYPAALVPLTEAGLVFPLIHSPKSFQE